MNPRPLAHRALVATAAALAAVPAAQASTLIPPTSTDNYYSRGRAVGISGGTALVASVPNTGVLGSAVYVYQGLNAATGAVSQSARLTTADGTGGTPGDNFGASVALSGGLGLVSASNFSSYSIPATVYVYRGLDTATGTVTENAKLRPSDGYNTGFASSVSLSGTMGLVGGATTGSSGYGQAYLYRNLDTATGTVTENVKLTPSDGTLGGRFGNAVSLSGGTGLVGAYLATVGSNSQQGAAYVYRGLDTATGTITESVKLVASDGAARDFFGYAVSQSGNTALVGAYRATATSTSTGPGAAYVFRNLDTATGTITQSVKLVGSDTVGGTSTTASAFGFSVGLSGNVALVGAPGTASGSSSGVTNQGAAYLYRNLDTASGTVTQNVKLFASDGAAGDRFGYAVSLDGDNFVIGAPQFQTSQAGKSYTGSLGSVSTLDLGNVSKTISGISFVSQDDWVVGQNTSGNQVTLSAGDSATVTASGKAVYVGQNAGSNNNRLVIAGTVNANSFVIGAAGNSGNTLQLGNGGTTGSLPTSATIVNNGVLAFNRSNAVVQGTDFNGAALTGAGGVTQMGSGTTTLNAANTYTGPTVVSGGTLQAGVASVPGVSGAFGNNSAVTMGNVAGATLALNGFNTQIGSLSGGGAAGGNVALGAATLTVGGDNTSPAAYAGSIAGTGGLVKIGTGTQTLSGTNTYTGATTVSAGTLVVNGSIGAGAVTVASGATLSGAGTLGGPVAVAGGTIAPGGAGGFGRLTVGSLSTTAASLLSFDLGGATATSQYDQLFAGGALSLGGSLSLTTVNGFLPTDGQSFTLIGNTSATATAILFANAPGGFYTNAAGQSFLITLGNADGGALGNDVIATFRANPTPEPSALAALGLGAVAFVKRRKRA